ncbi:unnamed protein product [Periconia digitata]|uniref:Uncharacterized protein n=1 Tax=Periconia digitata TaxID=1303443 RepID=A0A9W4UHL7_9PLEO|nr:unnamed protein product [Periconia digitata]
MNVGSLEPSLISVEFLGLTLCFPDVVGDMGGELERASWACLGVGLPVGHGPGGEVGALADRLRLLSTSSSTILMSRSAGSSTPALLTVRLRKFSARRSQP